MPAWIMGGSAVIAGALGYAGQQSANSASAAAAQANNQLQLESAQNKYQWTTADMQKAGLNPMLAYSQGAQGIGSLSMPTIGNSMGQGVGSAMQAYQTMAQVDNVKADTSNKQAQAALIQAQTDKTNAEIDTAKASAGSMIQQTAESQARIPEISAHIDLMQRQGSLTTNQAVVAKANFDNIQAMTSKLGLENAILEASKLPEASARGDFWSSDFGKKFPYIEPFLPAANSAGAAALKQWVK